MENKIFEIVIFLCLVILYFTIRNALPNYFKEKGKNLATKQDISEITNLVETVKHSFNKDLEILKSNLQTITNIKSGLVEQEINCIIAFNEAYAQWLHYLTDSSLGGIDTDSNRELKDYLKEINRAYSNLKASETRLNIFVENTVIIKLSDDLTLKTLELLNKLPPRFLIELKANNNLKSDINENKSHPDYFAKLKELRDERLECHKKYCDEITENYKTIVKLNHDFRIACRAHIVELMKNQEDKINY